jgi:hypothetical protein
MRISYLSSICAATLYVHAAFRSLPAKIAPELLQFESLQRTAEQTLGIKLKSNIGKIGGKQKEIDRGCGRSCCKTIKAECP